MLRKTLVAAVVVLVAGTAPAPASADQGVLVLAPGGTAEWNAELKELTAKANVKKPTELAFGAPTHATIEAAVDRLVRRGATEVTAVPFFLSTPLAPELGTGYPVPVRFASPLADDPVFADVMFSRAQEISHSPSDELVLLLGYGGDDDGIPWSVNLEPAAKRLNRMRRFQTILLIKGTKTAAEQQQARGVIETLARSHSRILVVPMLTLPSGGDPNLEQCLQGYPHELATSGALSDARLVDWLLTR